MGLLLALVTTEGILDGRSLLVGSSRMTMILAISWRFGSERSRRRHAWRAATDVPSGGRCVFSELYATTFVTSEDAP